MGIRGTRLEIDLDLASKLDIRPVWIVNIFIGGCISIYTYFGSIKSWTPSNWTQGNDTVRSYKYSQNLGENSTF